MTNALPPSAPSPDSPAPLLNWSEDQLVRLEYEWTRLQRAFAYHPFVRIVSMRDDPPGEYEIEFRVRTLAVGESGELEYAQAAPVRVWLPPSFPYSPPVVRPLTGLFHPNISWEGIHLSSAWQPTDTLAAYLKKIGELLAWRMYDPDAIVNPLAMDWLQQNPSLLPLDAQADFAPEAGGQPIERIRTYGPSTIEQVRAQLTALGESLSKSDSPPRAADVRDFARRTRIALKLFLADDVPAELRRDAASLDAWAAELPETLAAWDLIRSRKLAINSARAAAEALWSLRDPLVGQLAELDVLDPPLQPQDAFEALGAIPSPAALETLRLRLPTLVTRAQDAMKQLRAKLEALEGVLTGPAVPEDSVPGRQVRNEMNATSSDTVSVRELCRQALGETDPLLARAAAEADALKRITLWREYFDLLHSGRALEKKLAMWGGAGIHAYYIENESGRFGPFPFEQPIELGKVRFSVRSPERNRIELVDARTTRVLAFSDTGSIVHEIANSDGGERYPTSFHLTEHWEDLAVQIDFLIRQAGESLAQLASGEIISQSWCGRFLKVFAEPESQRLIADEHRRAGERWSRILADVRRLGPLKARIETWYLVERLTEAVPRIVRSLNEEKKKLRACTDELAAIIARCTRDIDTDRLVVPPKLARPYSEQTALRDRVQREIARIEKRLQDLAKEARQRLSSPAQSGNNAVPELRALPPLPQSLSAALAAMHDRALDELALALEKVLAVSLRSPQAANDDRPKQNPRAEDSARIEK